MSSTEETLPEEVAEEEEEEDLHHETENVIETSAETEKPRESLVERFKGLRRAQRPQQQRPSSSTTSARSVPIRNKKSKDYHYVLFSSLSLFEFLLSVWKIIIKDDYAVLLSLESPLPSSHKTATLFFSLFVFLLSVCGRNGVS
jgi:hypothetical protein